MHPYFDVKLNEVVVEEQRKEMALINPRSSNEEFIKYSFPSKNIEYLPSDPPVITTKLPGISEEYNNYVYLVEDEIEQGFRECLENVLIKDAVELEQRELQAQQFVLREKNKSRQAMKIAELLETECRRVCSAI